MSSPRLLLFSPTSIIVCYFFAQFKYGKTDQKPDTPYSRFNSPAGVPYLFD